MLVETLVAQLERPREVTPHVANYLNGNYDVERDAIGAFLTEKLQHLEDYEHETHKKTAAFTSAILWIGRRRSSCDRRRTVGSGSEPAGITKR